MHALEHIENRARGTYDFPFEFHHVTPSHPGYLMSYHWHVEYEIIRILSGSLFVTLDEKSFLAKEGDVIFIHSGVLHSGIPYDCIYQCIVFDGNTFLKYNSVCSSYIQKIIQQDIYIFHHFTDKTPEICKIVADLFHSMWKQEDGFELLVIGQFYHFWGEIFVKHYYLDNSADASRKSNRGYKKILQLKIVLDYIEHNYQNSVSLEDLSATLSMTPKYFCRFFSEMTHQTPIEYLNRQRIEHACYDIASTDNSITDIAYQCGFNDLSYFIRIFKKYKGTTPGRFNQRNVPRKFL